jgi:type IV secretory pathway VirJ component
VRRLFAFLALAMLATAARAECVARADVRDLPLVELPATAQKGDRFAIMISGDGGWRRIDTQVTDKLRADGMPVVGFLANEFFRTRRTPDDCGCALERVIRFYRIKYRKPNVVLIGYSRGADVLPFMASRIPADLRPSVKLIALLGLEATIDFKYTPSWFFWHFTKEPQFPVKPELEKLRGERILCVYGEKEKSSLCHQLDPGLAKILREPGGHHFAGKYADVAEAIIAEAAAAGPN